MERDSRDRNHKTPRPVTPTTLWRVCQGHTEWLQTHCVSNLYY